MESIRLRWMKLVLVLQWVFRYSSYVHSSCVYSSRGWMTIPVRSKVETQAHFRFSFAFAFSFWDPRCEILVLRATIAVQLLGSGSYRTSPQVRRIRFALNWVFPVCMCIQRIHSSFAVFCTDKVGFRLESGAHRGVSLMGLWCWIVLLIGLLENLPLGGKRVREVVRFLAFDLCAPLLVLKLEECANEFT